MRTTDPGAGPHPFAAVGGQHLNPNACWCGAPADDTLIHPQSLIACTVCGCYPAAPRTGCRCVVPSCHCPDPTTGGPR